MISEIDFTNIKESENFSYAQKLEFFNKNNKVNFEPGLNIIFAPNGTGKSTLLKIMAQFTASEQGGVSTITSSWAYEVAGFKENKLKGLSVKHDGQAVIYTNPREAIGLSGGQFDDDFFEQGLAETINRESTGLTTLARLNQAISILMGKSSFPDEIVKKRRVEPHVMAFLDASIPKGPRTLLLDEPESGLGLQIQRNMWKLINKGAKEHNLQVIVATHSMFALTCTANFIELKPGYIEQSKDCIQELAMMLHNTK